MRKTRRMIICLSFFMAIASTSHAQLSFRLDFGQDGSYETLWPLKSGEEVTVDIYVSNVPEGSDGNGLLSMGFKVEYDKDLLGVHASGTAVNEVLWPVGYLDLRSPGEIQMAGTRLPGTAIFGNDIKLGSVRFTSAGTGTVELRLWDRGDTVDEFVLFDGTVLDDAFPDRIFLTAHIVPPTSGDVNGDGVVNLEDGIISLQLMTRGAHGVVHNNADVDGDNKIGLQELIYILQKAAMLR